MFIGISGGASQTSISNHTIPDISGVSMTKRNSFSLFFEAGYLFNENLGLSTGLGISPYYTELSLDSYYNTLDTIDSENDSYERRISGSNINEVQRIYFLEIPVMFNLVLPNSRTNGFYIQTGINLSIPVIKNYSSSGTYSYSGYYPEYNVVLTDIPYEGFISDVESDVDGNLKIKTIIPELIACGGYYFYPHRKYQISLGLFYKRKFTDISGYSEVSSFQLSTQENHIRSFMQGSEKVTTSSMGIMVSLRYYIK